MTKTYLVKKCPSGLVSEALWAEVPAALIDVFPWDENGYRPYAEARVFFSDDGFHVRLRADESIIVAKGMNRNDFVHKDSCIEFFFNPDSDHDVRYINFEFNPIGTAYLSIGKDRFGRVFLDEQQGRMLDVRSTVSKDTLVRFSGPFWQIGFFIPFSLIEYYYGKVDYFPGKRMKGNFYKCGDDTAFPHFGCWNPIVWDKPDFHRPEFFGDLIIQ